MDEDDEFGDLYADVLHPTTSPSPQPPPASTAKPQTLASIPAATDRDEDWILGPAPIPEDPPLDWNDEDEEGLAAPRPAGSPEDQGVSEIRVSEEKKVESEQGIGDFDIEMDIPGLGADSVFRGADGGDAKGEGSEEWDSDSEDDLRIVLNDDSVGGRRGGGDGSEEDEDGEDDLVIVADDVQHHQYQVMEEHDWGEEALQVGLDGEKKEVNEAAKGNSGAGAVAGQRVRYGHGYHPQHHSQFKYVRPGAVDIPGGAAVGLGGAPGQVRPPLTMGLAAGRGRGAQKGFHSGYGLSNWANNNLSRPFGIGLDFTLPSHKTIFDINIDVFDEKPWRLPGVDVTDFFNFGLDEVSWKGYCKQLEQFRLESTMQSKIRVYESGRAEHDYDPDLPPELAAASGLHDLSAENTHPRKMDSGQLDVFSQGLGTMQRQSLLPTGRAIQVESSYGERLPSVDTRPPRLRDFEAIIEIVCHDFVDESDKSNIGSNQPGVEAIGDGPKGCYGSEENNTHDDPEYNGQFPRSRNDGREAIFSEVSTMDVDHNNVPEGHGIMASVKASGQHHCRSETESSSCSAGNLEESHNERQNTEKMDKSMDNDFDADNSLELSTSNGVENSKELIIEEPREEEHDDRLTLPDSPDGEVDDLPSDLHISVDSRNEDSLSYSAKTQKLNSQVEHPPALDNGDTEDLRTTFSDHSKSKSWSSMNYMKQCEDGEDEVVQAAGSRHLDDLGRDHSEGGCSSQQGDDYVQESRHEINGSHIPSKGREDLRRSRPHRGLDSNSVDYENSEGFERLKEKGTSSSGWNRRDVDALDLGRKDRDVKRRHNEEMRLKDRNRPLGSDRKGRGDDIHMRRGADDYDRRAHYGREGALRQRERNSIMMKQHEYFEDVHINRRKDEEHRKRESVPKENLHGYQIREDASHSRRGRIDSSENRIKEDVTRFRDRMGNPRSTKQKDDGSKLREREDRQRLKAEGYAHAHREREEIRTGAKGSRSLEDKSYGANIKIRGDRKGSDKDPLLKDRRHEQSRRGEQAKGDSHLQHKSREELHADLSQVNREDKSSRHGRLSNHSAHTSGAFSNQHMYREVDRENSKKSKNLSADQNGLVPGKRKHEDFTIQQCEKSRRTSPFDSSMKGAAYQETGNGSDTVHSKKNHHCTGEKDEGSGDLHTKSKDETVSDDENQQESRRGRSKLERWTSHKEREYSLHRVQSSSSLRAEDANGNNQDIVLCDELTMTEVNKEAENFDNKESTAIENSAKEEHDRHLETVEKLKKRSERFNLPMPGEKETIANKRLENELPVVQNESFVDSEVKQERPPRKRRWVSG